MTKKIYDLVVSTGSFTNRDGIEKRQYKTIGAVFQNYKGMFATLDRTFNPAGIPSDRDSIMVSMFEPKPRDFPKQVSQAHRADSQGDDFLGDVPF